MVDTDAGLSFPKEFSLSINYRDSFTWQEEDVGVGPDGKRSFIIPNNAA